MKNQSMSIIIPAYNEEAAVGKVIDSVKEFANSCKYDYEIIVIDDGSSDNTADIIKKKEEVILIQHSFNKGYGASLKHGIKQARFDNVIIIDADGTYPSDKIPELVKYLDEYDMVVASRTGKDVRIPILRKFAKYILNILANYLSGKKIPDLNSGFRALKKEAVIRFFNILPSGFSFTTTITLALMTNDYQIKYVPISYNHRNKESKFHPVKDTISMFTLIIRAILYFNPLKIFVPLSIVLVFAGVAVFIWSWLFAGRIYDITTALLIITGIQTLVIGLLADLIDKRIK